ncbi:MAG: Rieske 2Fe-2S domain-containing protein [Marinibacterium sp.]
MYTDLKTTDPAFQSRKGLNDRVVAGEVVVVREALQAFDCMTMLEEAAYRGIEKSEGKEIAEKVRKDGFHRIHDHVSATRIPALTDMVYDEVRPLASQFLRRFVPGVFPGVTNYYYEETPNVRFHIPYDLAEAHKKAFNAFAKDHGQGKIAAHGPHRDSWLDCPSNGLNLWFAIGRIRPGNGLTVFPEDYEGDYKYQTSGNILDGEKLHKTYSFDLHPGDVVMFHTDHVHGSELNRLDETRFAISFRMSIEKPVFPNLHFHQYVYSGWEGMPIKAMSQLPAMAQPSYVRSFAERVRNKLVPSMAPKEPAPDQPEVVGRKDGDTIRLPLSAIEVGEVRGISAALCVARLSETEIAAVTRRCPHQGGDLANGWVDGGQIVCPWHNLPFNAGSGRSECKSLPALKVVRAEIAGDEIVVYPKEVIRDAQMDEALAS